MADMEKFSRQNKENGDQPTDGSENVDTKRRTFLKVFGIGAAGAVVGAAGTRVYDKAIAPTSKEEKHEPTDDEIIGRPGGQSPVDAQPQHVPTDDEIIGRDIHKK